MDKLKKYINFHILKKGRFWPKKLKWIGKSIFTLFSESQFLKRNTVGLLEISPPNWLIIPQIIGGDRCAAYISLYMGSPLINFCGSFLRGWAGYFKKAYSNAIVESTVRCLIHERHAQESQPLRQGHLRPFVQDRGRTVHVLKFHVVNIPCIKNPCAVLYGKRHPDFCLNFGTFTCHLDL